MTTRKSEGRTVVKWMVLVIQVLIVLKGVEGQATSSVSSSVSLSTTASLPISATTSFSAATTTPQLSSSSVGLSAPTATPQSSSSSVGLSVSTATPQSSSSSVGQTVSTATPQSSSSSVGLSVSTATPQSSSSSVGLSVSTATPQSSSSSVGQTVSTATPRSSSSSVGLSVSTATPQSSSSSVGLSVSTATPQSSSSSVGLSVSTATPQSSSSSVGPSVSTATPQSSSSSVGLSMSTATPQSSSSSVGQTVSTATPQSSSSSVGLSVSTATPQSSSSSVGQTVSTATPQSSSSSVGLSVSTATPQSSSSSFGQTAPSSTSSSQTPAVATSKATTTPAVPTSTTSFSSSVTATVAPQSSKVPSVYIKMTFSMPWGRFCYLISLFKESLSRDLLEFDGVYYHFVQLQRIKLINAKEKCANKTLYHNKEAILTLYISNREQEFESNATDGKEMTIKAFKLLHGYWVNERMILLDKVFERKVTNVELIGADASPYIDTYTEAQHIGIAIGIALAIVALLLIIIFCVKGYGAIKRFGRRPGDGKTIFKNEHVLEENTTNESGKTAQPRDEPEEVVVHMHTQPSPPQTQKSEPVTTAQDEMPLLSAIMDYEDGKKVDETKSDEEPHVGEVPLAKPESDNVSEGEPIQPPRSDSMVAEDAITPEETPAINEAPVTDEPAKTEDEDTGKPAQPEEEGIRERKPTFTSSVTIVITPEAGSTPPKFEFKSPATEHPPEKGDSKQAPAGADGVSGDENAKPDFGQSESSDADPNQGAINLGFDDNDEAPNDEKEEEEETKF